jgi:urease accessory protein
MILVKEKLGNIHSASAHERDIDVLLIEWHEARKRILHKQTSQGKDVTLKFLNENPNLKDGDILWQGENTIIAVEINRCDCIVIVPESMLQASSVCYEIGNRHLPLFYEGDELLVPYDVPMYNLLQGSGYTVKVEERKLNNSFQTTVLPHLQVGITDSLPNKIHQLITSL